MDLLSGCATTSECTARVPPTLGGGHDEYPGAAADRGGIRRFRPVVPRAAAAAVLYRSAVFGCKLQTWGSANLKKWGDRRARSSYRRFGDARPPGRASLRHAARARVRGTRG